MVKVEYSYLERAMEMLRWIGMPGVGIIDNRIALLNRLDGFPKLVMASASTPVYERAVLEKEIQKSSSHSGGYGISLDEAITKCCSEAIERYALTIGQKLIEDKIIYASYDELEKGGRNIIPSTYLDIISPETVELLDSSKIGGLKRFSKGGMTGWLPCKSIFKPSKEIMVPSHLLFHVYKTSSQHGEEKWMPSISTGTACHFSVEEAMINALLEYLERDSFGVRWYTMTKAKRVIIDDPFFSKWIEKFFGSKFKLLPLYLSLPDCPAHVFGVFLINKQDRLPYISFGMSASLNPFQGLYRAIAEASATAILSLYGSVSLPEFYATEKRVDNILDLDRNLALFASPAHKEITQPVIQRFYAESISLSSLDNLSKGNPRKDLVYLLSSLKDISEKGIFLDITPPEVANIGYRVMRVYIPELFPLCLPSLPYGYHPRIIQFGGLSNTFPHPMP